MLIIFLILKKIQLRPCTRISLKYIPGSEIASHKVYVWLALLINAQMLFCYSLYPFMLTSIGDERVPISKPSC